MGLNFGATMEYTTAELRELFIDGTYPDGLRVCAKMPAAFADMEVAEGFPDRLIPCGEDEEPVVKTYRQYLIIYGENEEYVIARLCTKEYKEDGTGNLIIPGGLKSPELEELCKIVPIDCLYSHEDALIERDKLNDNEEMM